MAYLNYLASVPQNQIRDFQGYVIGCLSPALLADTTHALVSWLRFDELREIVQVALDGGTVLRADLWHPLRPPHVHSPAEVARILPRLRGADERFLASLPPEDRELCQRDLQPLLDVFAYAAARGNCVVSALEPPVDHARASRIVLPFTVSTQAT